MSGDSPKSMTFWTNLKSMKKANQFTEINRFNRRRLMLRLIRLPLWPMNLNLWLILHNRKTMKLKTKKHLLARNLKDFHSSLREQVIKMVKIVIFIKNKPQLKVVHLQMFMMNMLEKTLMRTAILTISLMTLTKKMNNSKLTEPDKTLSPKQSRKYLKLNMWMMRKSRIRLYNLWKRP